MPGWVIWEPVSRGEGGRCDLQKDKNHLFRCSGSNRLWWPTVSRTRMKEQKIAFPPKSKCLRPNAKTIRRSSIENYHGLILKVDLLLRHWFSVDYVGQVNFKLVVMLLPQLPECWECRFVPVMLGSCSLRIQRKKDSNQYQNNNRYILIACESQVITYSNKVMGQGKEQQSAIKSGHDNRHLHSIPSKVTSWILINNRAGRQPWVPDAGAPPTCFSLAFQFELAFTLYLVCLVTHQTEYLPHHVWKCIWDADLMWQILKQRGQGVGTSLTTAFAWLCCAGVVLGTVACGFGGALLVAVALREEDRPHGLSDNWSVKRGKDMVKRTTHGSKPPTTWEAPSQDIVKAIRAAPGTSIILNRLCVSGSPSLFFSFQWPTFFFLTLLATAVQYNEKQRQNHIFS